MGKKSNKTAKEKLIELFGPECFIEKLHLRKDKKPRKYKSKGQRKRMKQLTYHHIKEKRKGGKATVENGALLSAENHIWFNKQGKEEQNKMNKLFQKYKLICLKIIANDKNIELEKLARTSLEENDVPKEILDSEIPLEDNIKERNEDIER